MKNMHTYQKSIRNTLVGVLIFAGMIGGVFALTATRSEAALTDSQIQAILGLLSSFGADQTTISNVNANLRGLPTTGATAPVSAGVSAGVCPFTWTINLKVGSDSADVKKLQQFLNANPATVIAATGAGSVGNESTYYGPKTGAAVKKFQELYASEILTPNGLTSGTPNFGNATRAKANALCATMGNNASVSLKSDSNTSNLWPVPNNIPMGGGGGGGGGGGSAAPAITSNGGGGGSSSGGSDGSSSGNGGGSGSNNTETNTNNNNSNNNNTDTTTNPVAPTLALTASSIALPHTGGSVRFDWTSTHASICTASGAWNGVKATSGTETVNVTSSGTFTLMCSEGTAHVTKQIAVTVADAPIVVPAPTLTFTTSVNNLPAGGGSHKLTWSAVNAVSCTASNGWSGDRATAGSLTRTITATTLYRLTCVNSNGVSVAKDVQVTVAAPVTPTPTDTDTVPPPPSFAVPGAPRTPVVTPTPTAAPTLTFAANQTSFPVGGGTLKLTWETTNATACTGSGAWGTVSRPTQNLNYSRQITQTGTFTLTCTGEGGAVAKSVRVTVGQ